MRIAKRTIWYGVHREVRYTVEFLDTLPSQQVYNSDFPNGRWVSYIYLNPKCFLEKELQDAVSHSNYYNDQNILRKLCWHGGITFSECTVEKYSDIEMPRVSLKVGCDYQHYYDIGKFYDENIVEDDIKAVIDNLYDIYPNFIPPGKVLVR